MQGSKDPAAMVRLQYSTKLAIPDLHLYTLLFARGIIPLLFLLCCLLHYMPAFEDLVYKILGDVRAHACKHSMAM